MFDIWCWKQELDFLIYNKTIKRDAFFLLQYIQLCVAYPGQLPARLEKLVRMLI